MPVRLSRYAVFTVILLLIAGLAGSLQASEVTTLEDALKLSAGENKPVVLDFYTDW